MSFIDNAKRRYSVRKYQTRKVEREKLLQILEAGRVAPTGANLQPFHLLVVQEEEGLRKIGKATNIFRAPLAIIVCGKRGEAWVRPFDGKNIVDIDASIVTDHMMMEATDLGLGSVWICYFKPDVIRSEFNLPDDLEPINILALGYADGQPLSPDRHDTLRRPMDELVSYEMI